ncbi:MAG: iron-containing alcohol dehydrogenase [Desulfovibrio sp.]|uniref:iron-containing alcohol dehydrogenase n=1 Tax=Desulfovibrio sp. TaxID=885 RepID=UPI0039E5C002
MWDNCYNYDTVREIRVKTTAYVGVGAIDRIGYILGNLKNEGVSSVLCVCGGHAYRASGAWDKAEAAAQKQGIVLALYNRVTPNPTTDIVNDAAALGRAVNAGAVLAIGGGSPLDCGKGAAILLANPGKSAEDLFCFRFTPQKALPLIAVNLTHGTGSEVNRFAVVTVAGRNHRSIVGHDCSYPRYAIDDPALMTGLSAEQSRYVSIDALCRVVEASTTTLANPLVVTLASETVRLVHTWLPIVLAEPENLKARYGLCMAALQAGVAFDNSLLHMAHALEQPLSRFRDVPHGLALAMLLPAVIGECYAARPDVLAHVLEPLAPGLKGEPDEAATAAKAVEDWLFSLGINQKLLDFGVQESDVEEFCNFVEQTPSLGLLLSVAPVRSSRQRVARIYTNSLRPMP